MTVANRQINYLHDVIVSSQVERLSTNVEGHHRQRGNLLAVNQILVEIKGGRSYWTLTTSRSYSDRMSPYVYKLLLKKLFRDAV